MSVRLALVAMTFAVVLGACADEGSEQVERGATSVATERAIAGAATAIVPTATASVPPKQESPTAIPTPLPTIRLAQLPPSSAPYQVVQSWAIPAGGRGASIAVSADQDLAALDDRLRDDYRGDRNAVIVIFTDRRAAELRDAVLGGRAVSTEVALYERAFVATYLKNGQTEAHTYTYCLRGFVAAIDCTSRRY